MDLQLPDVVEAHGFQRLVATLRSPCEIPSRIRLIDDVLPKIYDTYKEMVAENINSAVRNVCISVEEWQSSSSDTYVTFSAHFQMVGVFLFNFVLFIFNASF